MCLVGCAWSAGPHSSATRAIGLAVEISSARAGKAALHQVVMRRGAQRASESEHKEADRRAELGGGRLNPFVHASSTSTIAVAAWACEQPDGATNKS